MHDGWHAVRVPRELVFAALLAVASVASCSAPRSAANLLACTKDGRASSKAAALCLAERDPRIKGLTSLGIKLMTVRDFYEDRNSTAIVDARAGKQLTWVVFARGQFTPQNPGAGEQPWAYILVDVCGQVAALLTYQVQPADWNLLPDQSSRPVKAACP